MEVPPPEVVERGERKLEAQAKVASSSEALSSELVDFQRSSGRNEIAVLEQEERNESAFLEREEGNEFFLSESEDSNEIIFFEQDDGDDSSTEPLFSSSTKLESACDPELVRSSSNNINSSRLTRNRRFEDTDSNGNVVDTVDATSLVSSLSADFSATGVNEWNHSASFLAINRPFRYDLDDDGSVESNDSLALWDAKNSVSTLSFPRTISPVPRFYGLTTSLSLAPQDEVPACPILSRLPISSPPRTERMALDQTSGVAVVRPPTLAVAVEVQPPPRRSTMSNPTRTREEERAEFARQVRRALEEETVRADPMPAVDDSIATPMARHKDSRRGRIYHWSIILVVVALLLIGGSIAIVRFTQQRPNVSCDDDGTCRASNNSTHIAPFAPPSASPLVYSTKNGKLAFTSTIQLYEAVDAFVAASADTSGKVSESLVATTFGYPIREWDVSRLSDFSRVFNANRDQKLDPNIRLMGYSPFNDDLSGWDVSRARSMYAMFAGAKDFVGVGLDQWNVSQVSDFSFMFVEASSFVGNVTHWSTTSATTMLAMFKGAKAFNGDLSRFDTSKVETMAFTFNLASNFQGNGLSGWNVGKVHNMDSMFSETFLLAEDLSLWEVGNVENMQNLFFLATSFDGDLSLWRVDKVYTMAAMFYGATSFRGISTSNRSLSGWNTSRVTDIQKMFERCHVFQGDVSGFDVSKVTNFYRTFYECHLFDSDLSRWQMGQATILSEMFCHAFKFASDISKWDTSRAREMRDMFWNAYEFNSDVSGWNVSLVKDTSAMFGQAVSFRQNLCDWGPQLLPSTNVQNMFLNATACESDENPVLWWNESFRPTAPGPFCFHCGTGHST